MNWNKDFDEKQLETLYRKVIIALIVSIFALNASVIFTAYKILEHFGIL